MGAVGVVGAADLSGVGVAAKFQQGNVETGAREGGRKDTLGLSAVRTLGG